MAPREKQPADEQTAQPAMPQALPCPCPRCGGQMVVIEILARSWAPDYQSPLIRFDTS
jgi:hypothetical protein